MDKQQILDYILHYINTEFGETTGKVEAHTPLLASRLLDSINTLRMISDFEEHFKFEAEAHEINPDNLDTPELIAVYIGGKLS